MILLTRHASESLLIYSVAKLKFSLFNSEFLSIENPFGPIPFYWLSTIINACPCIRTVYGIWSVMITICTVAFASVWIKASITIVNMDDFPILVSPPYTICHIKCKVKNYERFLFPPFSSQSYFIYTLGLGLTQLAFSKP